MHKTTNANLQSKPKQNKLKFTDFFCGIGGFHIGAQNLGMECVFASDIDVHAQDAYEANFGLRPVGAAHPQGLGWHLPPAHSSTRLSCSCNKAHLASFAPLP